MKKVIAIVGPTATGKTKLSLEIAKHFGLEIINGDSVQVHKDLNIGSAKVTSEEANSIVHHLIDLVGPGEKYTVYNFQQDARRIIDKQTPSLIVGGTGLYIKAALYDYEFIEEEKKINYESFLENSTEGLYSKLIKLNPGIEIEPNNRNRVIRALDLAEKGVFSKTKTKKSNLIYDALIIYLDIDREILKTNLIRRLDQQLETGFIKEVEDLRQLNIFPNIIGYREINKYLDKEYNYDEMKEKIMISSMQFAKRQKTWFHNQMKPIVFNSLSPTLFEDVKLQIETFLEAK